MVIRDELTHDDSEVSPSCELFRDHLRLSGLRLGFRKSLVWGKEDTFKD